MLLHPDPQPTLAPRQRRSPVRQSRVLVRPALKPFEAEALVKAVTRFVAPSAGEVLVVDDDTTSRELVGRHLRRAGFSTAEATNGQEALLRMRVIGPSLVVLDLVMPGLDGFDVLRSMRESGSSTPVIVLTAATLDEAQKRTLRDGMAEIVAKGGRAACREWTAALNVS